MPDACIIDPWYSCNPADRPRTVLRLHCNDEPTDAFFPQTVLVLNFETDASDSSAAGQVMALTGAGAITNTRSRFGTLAYENTAAGSNHGIETAAANILAGSDALPLCIEVWVYRTSSGTRQSVLGLSNAFDLYIDADGTVGGWYTPGFEMATSAVVPLNTWTCISFQTTAKVSGNRSFTLYRNGGNVLGGAGGQSYTVAGGSRITVGKGRFASFIGSIGAARVASAARWETLTNYRVPLMPFPTRLQPALLDTSCGNLKTVTVTGAATTSNERTLFGPRSLYVPALASTNNSVDGAQVAPHSDFNFGSADLTLRLWFNRLSATREGRLFTAEMAGGEFTFALLQGSNTISATYRSNGGAQPWINATAVPLNTWRQLLIQRRAANWETYLHGTLIDSRAITGGGSATVNWSGNLWLGRQSAASNQAADAFLTEIDIVAGVALASGNFTVPDLPTCDYGGPNYFAPGARVWPAGVPQ